jgi:hypothetical protein
MITAASEGPRLRPGRGEGRPGWGFRLERCRAVVVEPAESPVTEDAGYLSPFIGGKVSRVLRFGLSGGTLGEFGDGGAVPWNWRTEVKGRPGIGTRANK